MLDTGIKFKKISKSRDGFFSRGENIASFMELGIELNRMRGLQLFLILITGNKSLIK